MKQYKVKTDQPKVTAYQVNVLDLRVFPTDILSWLCYNYSEIKFQVVNSPISPCWCLVDHWSDKTFLVPGDYIVKKPVGDWFVVVDKETFESEYELEETDG